MKRENKNKYSNATKSFIERYVEFKEMNYDRKLSELEVSWGKGTFEDDLEVGNINDAYFSIAIV